VYTCEPANVVCAGLHVIVPVYCDVSVIVVTGVAPATGAVTPGIADIVIGAGTMIMVSCFVSSPTLFDAFTVNVYVPAVVGVPDISPDVDNDSPPGRLPTVIDHVIGGISVRTWITTVLRAGYRR